MRIDNVNRIITVLIATSQLDNARAAPAIALDTAKRNNGLQSRTNNDGKNMLRTRSDTLTAPVAYGTAYLRKGDGEFDNVGKRSNSRKKKRAAQEVTDKGKKKEEEDSDDEFSTDSEYDSTDEEEGTHSGSQYWKPSRNSYWTGKWGDDSKAPKPNATMTSDQACKTEEGQNKLPKGACLEQADADNIVGV
jgi:hypothetical protein